MNFAAVFHRAQAPYSYARNKDELVIRLQTDPEVEKVFLHWGDPFEAGILGGAERWHGERVELPQPLRLRHVCWWTAVIRPPYKRCRYHLSSIRMAKHGFLVRMASVRRKSSRKTALRLPFTSHG